jgi:hypothetical protein
VASVNFESEYSGIRKFARLHRKGIASTKIIQIQLHFVMSTVQLRLCEVRGSSHDSWHKRSKTDENGGVEHREKEDPFNQVHAREIKNASWCQRSLRPEIHSCGACRVFALPLWYRTIARYD